MTPLDLKGRGFRSQQEHAKPNRAFRRSRAKS